MNQSSGGILVCAEVPFLPYMNLRPFRVDADGIHMYAWAPNGRTPYFSDLGVGETVLAVNTSGRARPVTVGRIKAEVRPLRLIECRAQDRTLSVLLQADRHVRVFDAAGEVRNSTDIHVGDRLQWTLDRRFSRWLDRGDADVGRHGPDRQIGRRRRLVRGGRQPGRPLRILGRRRGRGAGHRAQLVSARTG
jgi:3-dehydroquinate synthase class II